MRHVRSILCAWLVLAGTAGAQQTALKPGENLVIRGIPPVPNTILASISPYSEFRQAASLSWIGSARELLIATRFGATYQVHRVAMPGGARSQLTFVPDGIAASTPAEAIAVARPDGRSFVYVRDVGSGAERLQLFRYDLESGSTTLLTDGQSRNESPVWSLDGKRLAFTSNRRSAADRDLYVMDPDRPDGSRMVAKARGNWQVHDWSPDGVSLLSIEWLSATESRLWLVDVDSGRTRELPLATGPSLTRMARFGADARTVFAVNDAGSEFLRLVRLDVGSDKVTPVAASPRGDAESLSVSSDGTLVAVAVTEEGLGTLRVYDASTGRERALRDLPRGSVLSARWRPNSRELAFDVVSSRHPRDVYSVDVSTGRVSRWTAGETNGVSPSQLAEAEVIRWKSFDGLTITGVLYRPPARFTGRRPVMINIHGGPAAQERPRFLGFSNYFINELGIAIVYPNVRGSAGFGKSFLKADDGLRREDAVKDIGALLDWIAASPDLDPSRVMVTGASFGGYMTYAVATTYPDRIRCAFAGAGISNLVTDLERTAPEGRDQRRAEYGDERIPEVRAYLERIAPIGRASALNQPLFIAHGRNDPRVPVQEAEQMATAVEKNGKPLWYLVVNDEGHAIGAHKPVQDYLFSAWALFAQEYLVK